ncbi:hypothetical protein [Grimontia sedimenti]|nr:hypothetical protein [Grimontia sedimenti]
MNLTGTGRRRGVELMGLALVVAFGYFFADKTLFDEATPAMPSPALNCTIGTTPCTFDHATVSMASATAAPLIPTEIRVEVSNASVDHLMVELQGVEMNMGIYKLKLSSAGNNLYTGDLMLPICMEDEMTWRGVVKSPDNALSLPIDVRMAR